jgi:hypothetical protein
MDTHATDRIYNGYKGHLIELLNNKNIWKEKRLFYANSLHEPVCEIDSEY